MVASDVWQDALSCWNQTSFPSIPWRACSKNTIALLLLFLKKYGIIMPLLHKSHQTLTRNGFIGFFKTTYGVFGSQIWQLCCLEESRLSKWKRASSKRKIFFCQNRSHRGVSRWPIQRSENEVDGNAAITLELIELLFGLFTEFLWQNLVWTGYVWILWQNRMT